MIKAPSPNQTADRSMRRHAQCCLFKKHIQIHCFRPSPKCLTDTYSMINIIHGAGVGIQDEEKLTKLPESYDSFI